MTDQDRFDALRERAERFIKAGFVTQTDADLEWLINKLATVTAERDALQQQVDQMVAPEELRQWRARAEALEAQVIATEAVLCVYEPWRRGI